MISDRRVDSKCHLIASRDSEGIERSRIKGRVVRPAEWRDRFTQQPLWHFRLFVMMDEALRRRRVKARDSVVWFLWRPCQSHLKAPVRGEGGGGQDTRR